MVMTYSEARRISGRVFDRIAFAAGCDVHERDNSTDGDFLSGMYGGGDVHIMVGTKPLAAGLRIGIVSYTDCVSMCRQALHEYRHWQQSRLFRGLPCDPSAHGLPAVPFGDDAFCHMMARQRIISAEFPAYKKANQFALSYERDAEEYAVRAVTDVLLEAGFPGDHIEPYLVYEINRRDRWYGSRPVLSSVAAADDLRMAKSDVSAARLPDRYPYGSLRSLVITSKGCVEEPVSGVADSFLDDKPAREKYKSLDPADGDRFLFDYIVRRDPKICRMYPIINDEMPELTPREKMQRVAYRMAHDVPDENTYGGLEL